MKTVKKMTTKELKEEYLACSQVIDKIECFSTHDLLWRDSVESELIRRGWGVVNQPRFQKIHD